MERKKKKSQYAAAGEENQGNLILYLKGHFSFPLTRQQVFELPSI